MHTLTKISPAYSSLKHYSENAAVARNAKQNNTIPAYCFIVTPSFENYPDEKSSF